MQYPFATIGTAATIGAALAVERIGVFFIDRRAPAPQQRYSWKSNFRVTVFIVAAIIVALFWIRLFNNKGTFFGLLAAGLAVAMREPLLSIAGRISIWAGRLYRMGDRIEFEGMAGDVIAIGTFYTRMLEIGNWIKADQSTGRIVQFSNARVYQHPVYNYTQGFSYIWDEIMLPVTYASDVKAATEILIASGQEYTRKFVENAGGDVTRLRHSFFVPDLNLEPTVYTRVTSNYVELTMRYVVDPRQRRTVSSNISSRVLERVRENAGIDIGSDTMDLTVHAPQKKSKREERAD